MDVYTVGILLLVTPIQSIHITDKAFSFEEKTPTKPPATNAVDDAIRSFILNNFTTSAAPKLGGGQPEPDCVCVPYFLCQDGYIVTSGDGLLDPRARMSLPLKGGCDNALDLCCKPPPGSSRMEPSSLVSNNTILEGILSPENEEERCGIRPLLESVIMEEEVRNGLKSNLSALGEFPWMAALLRKEVKKNPSTKEETQINVFVCGGSLIHRKAVLTAAHCVDKIDLSNLLVRLGEWDTQSRNDFYPYQDRKVIKVEIKKDYYRGTLFNDAALLILEQPVKLAANIFPICLPKQGISFVGATCVASGWGKNSYGVGGKYSNILKKVELPVVSRDTCETALKTTRLGKYFILHSSFLCAGGLSREDTCKGDGGSPLVCYDTHAKVYVQVGIVSWGISCGETNIPGVYADVIYLGEWIRETLAKHVMN